MDIYCKQKILYQYRSYKVLFKKICNKNERSSKLAVTILWDKNRLKINIIVAVLNIPRSYLYENDFIV